METTEKHRATGHYLECAEASCAFPLRRQDPERLGRAGTSEDAREHVRDTGHTVSVYYEGRIIVGPGKAAGERPC